MSGTNRRLLIFEKHDLSDSVPIHIVGLPCVFPDFGSHTVMAGRTVFLI